jgi:nucleoside 2-deoxyribosyltransferase
MERNTRPLESAAGLVYVLAGEVDDEARSILRDAERLRLPVVCAIVGPLGADAPDPPFVLPEHVVRVRSGTFPVDEIARVLARALGDRARIEAVQRLPYGIEKREAWRTLNREIGATNRAAIDRAHGVIAVLDGVDVDSGTAAEVGYAFARGKLIVGYRGDFRLSADNEGSTVNLQVEFFIRESGGAIVSRYEDLEAHLRPLRAAR